jgi:cytochrome bd-type quinol oxidase subunit 1
MTKIVRASLGLPTLRAGPQFQNSKPVLVIEYWNLRFICNLVLGIWLFCNASVLLNTRQSMEAENWLQRTANTPLLKKPSIVFLLTGWTQKIL